MSGTLNVLLEMGFSKTKAERALAETGNSSIEAAMEWLMVHNEDPEPEEPNVANANSEAAFDDDDACTPVDLSMERASEMEAEAVQPKSLKCDECGKKFKSEVEVEFHAVKSGHQSFSESTEEIKPLTEEEKKEKLRKMEEKIKERRLQREEQNKKEEIEKEKVRRKTGQEVALARQRIHEEEMKKLAEQTRKEKAEKLLARQRVLEEIERDKQARKEKFGSGAPTVSAQSHSISTEAAVTQAFPKKDYDQSKIQIRLTNGQTLVQTFATNEQLAAVRLYIQLNRTDGSEPFTIMTNFPRKVFSEEDMEKPLAILGLVPSAVLILTKAQS